MLSTMKRAAALAGALMFTAGAAGAVPAAAPSGGAPPPAKPAVAKPASVGDKAQIEALERGFSAAFSAKNVDKVMSYYARDGLFVFDVTPPREHVGWADYKKDWQDLFAANPGPVSVKISELSITVVGPVAYGHSVQDSHFTAKNGVKSEAAVRVTDVYRKQGGAWKIVQEHVSVPVDLATGKADMLSKP
jgi:uncharacterized protein (TIGR02246 family)